MDISPKRSFPARALARSRVFCILLFLLFSAKLANATAIYTFSLPANGSVSALTIQLTTADLLPAGGLQVIPLNNPAVSVSFSTAGFNPATSVLGLQITPTATLIGIALANTAGQTLLFTPGFPADFFSFSRNPLATGTFTATGNVTSILPLATSTPTGTLTVTSTSVPEPASALILLSGLCAGGWLGLRRRE
jgi:hypothetical protein